MYRVTGDILMVHVFELIHTAHNLIGGRFVFLDYDIEHPKLIEKYKEYGFVFLQNRVNEGNEKT